MRSAGPARGNRQCASHLSGPCEVRVGNSESHREHFPQRQKDRVTMRDQRGLGPLIDHGLHVHHHLPALRTCCDGTDAIERLPDFLWLQRMQCSSKTKTWRLLRILFLRLGPLSADPSQTGRCAAVTARRFLTPWSVEEQEPCSHGQRTCTLRLMPQGPRSCR